MHYSGHYSHQSHCLFTHTILFQRVQGYRVQYSTLLLIKGLNTVVNIFIAVVKLIYSNTVVINSVDYLLEVDKLGGNI